MKKTFALMIAVFVAAMFFTSCEKEGVYEPKQKISEIKHNRYHALPSGTTISNNEREVWTWNGKVLSYIDYYNAKDERIGTTLFRYDENNRISEINYGSNTAKFNYVDNLINEIEIFNTNGAKVGKFELEHKGSKVSAMNVTLNDDKSLITLPFNPLSLFIPENAADKVLECSNTKGTTHVALTWTGNNVTAMEVKGSYNGAAPTLKDGTNVTAMEMKGSYNVSYKWTYDENNNPYKGLFDVDALSMDAIFSANNVVREVISQGSSSSTTDFTYTYDGKNCPVKKSWESVVYLSEFGLDVPVTYVDEFKY